MKLCYFHALKALWHDQGKIKMYHGMSRVTKQLSGKKSITTLVKQWIYFFQITGESMMCVLHKAKPVKDLTKILLMPCHILQNTKN